MLEIIAIMMFPAFGLVYFLTSRNIRREALVRRNQTAPMRAFIAARKCSAEQRMAMEEREGKVIH